MGRNSFPLIEASVQGEGELLISLNAYLNAARGVTGHALSNKEILLRVLRLKPEARTRACTDMDQILKDFIVPFPVAFRRLAASTAQPKSILFELSTQA